MCNCGNCAGDCAPQVVMSPSTIPGPAGLPPQFVATQAIALPAGSQPTATVTGVSPILTLTIGIPAGATPAFAVGTVTDGPLGVTITGTLLNPVLNFSIPSGQDGEDGQNAFTNLTAGFEMPAVGSTVTITVADSEWMGLGAWIWVETAGVFRVAAQPAAPFTSVTLRNPGAGDGFPSGVTGNAAPSVAIINFGTPAQVSPSGRPAVGIQGPPGDAPGGGTGTDIPTLAPPEGSGFFIYADDLDAPSVARMYVWNAVTSSWDAGPSVLGPAGTRILFVSSDPSMAPPAGAIGTVIIRTDVPGIYRKDSAVTATLEASLTSTFQQVADASSGNTGTTQWNLQRSINLVPLSDTHAAPGTYTLDLAYPEIFVDCGDDIQLDWTGTNSAEWVFRLLNSSGGSIDLTFATGKWSKADGLALSPPIAIPDGDMVVITARKVVMGSTPYVVIEQIYTVTPL